MNLVILGLTWVDMALYDEPNISGGNLRRLDFSADFRRVTHLTWSQFVLVRQ